MTERKQMYQKDVLAMADPIQRHSDLRWGQAIVNTYPDYFKGSHPELFYTKNDDVVRAIMNAFFYANQIPVDRDSIR